MYHEVRTTLASADRSRSEGGGVIDNRIEALRSLASLLLREVESLQGTGATDGHTQLPAEGQIDLSIEMERFEIDLIRTAMIRARGCQRHAASILGTKPTTLNAKIKRYGIENFIALGKL